MTSMPEDTRNVTDEFKGMSEESISALIDERGSRVEIAIENSLRDFNMGTIVRSANAFGIRTVHIVGRRQWNKRGAMMTDKYLNIQYHDNFTSLRNYADKSDRQIIAIDNIEGSIMLQKVEREPESILLFGQEGPGLSDEALAVSDNIVAIEQTGSTRSINVGAAATIAMYEWVFSPSSLTN